VAARVLPVNIPRIALVDFNNDSLRDSQRVLDAMFAEYRQLFESGDEQEAARHRLYGCVWIQAAACATNP